MESKTIFNENRSDWKRMLTRYKAIHEGVIKDGSTILVCHDISRFKTFYKLINNADISHKQIDENKYEIKLVE